MPPIIIAAVIAGGASVAGSAMSARSNNKATKTADRYNREALAWEKDRTYAEDARLQPYREMGGKAYGQLGQMLGVDGAAPLPQPHDSFSFAQPMPQPHGAPSTARPMGGEMVQIQAPDGRVRPVPAHKVQRYVQRGGRVVDRGGTMPPQMEARV